MEIKGKIKLINGTSESASGFRKREFVVTTTEQYPQDIKLELTKDKCDQLDGFSIGENVTVSFNLRGNEYQGKYYVSLQAWKIVREQ
jgi:single-strand DNA-binding protein